MDNLPPELLNQVLSHVPKSSLSSCRLVCRSFSELTFPRLFAHIPNWLDYDMSHSFIVALAHDAFNRPAVMWSRWGTVSEGVVEDVWMGLVWKLLMNSPPPGYGVNAGAVEGVGEGEKTTVQLTSKNFAELSGREEMTENRLRTGQNRFLLHRSYSRQGRWENMTG